MDKGEADAPGLSGPQILGGEGAGGGGRCVEGAENKAFKAADRGVALDNRRVGGVGRSKRIVDL